MVVSALVNMRVPSWATAKWASGVNEANDRMAMEVIAGDFMDISDLNE